ncbi:DUF222 domain-containing protein, partial [Brevibacterium sp.]|uniref:DUF222 domain-containing protein n=1 Tax=Brevibacterium sp. TaxID=1701 RepID=UPI0035C82967
MTGTTDPGTLSAAGAEVPGATEADAKVPVDVALFPGFEPEEGFSAWTCTHLAKDDLRQVTAILGTTIGRAKRKVGTAMTLVHGLPQFCQRVRAGEFTAAHVEVVMYACDTLAMRHLPVVDRYLKQRRADVTCETLKRTLLQQIMVIQPPV